MNLINQPSIGKQSRLRDRKTERSRYINSFDGETSKISYATYKDRYSGFGGDSPEMRLVKLFPHF